MQYWRMQLHPTDHFFAMRHTVESIGAGFIGLDFDKDRGNMLQITDPTLLPKGQRKYWDFAHKMSVEDKVLIMVHHLPFALVTVESEYNYILNPKEAGLWFRHFRRIKPSKTYYYADWKIDPSEWESITMVDTISKLGAQTRSYQLISKWLHDTAREH